MKKEIPILMTGMMVCETIEGRKNVTRRMRGLKKINENPDRVRFLRFQHYTDGSYRAIFQHEDSDTPASVKSPYGKPGDILWVRETHFRNGDEWIYLADGTCCEQFEQCECSEVGKPKWIPSIHMVKEASRIWLEVTDIRIKRLQDISEKEAEAEGAQRGIFMYGPNREKGEFHLEINRQADYRDGFRFIWCLINGLSSWDANPWVWVVEFKVLSTQGKP